MPLKNSSEFVRRYSKECIELSLLRGKLSFRVDRYIYGADCNRIWPFVPGPFGINPMKRLDFSIKVLTICMRVCPLVLCVASCNSAYPGNLHRKCSVDSCFPHLSHNALVLRPFFWVPVQIAVLNQITDN